MVNESGNGMYMPVVPQGYGMGSDMFGGNWAWWIIILLIFGGWGNNGFGGFGGNGAYSEVQRGFDQNAVMNGITGIQNSLTNGFAQAEISANSRQMADMNQSFAMQSALQQCLTKTRESIKRVFDTKYIFNNGTCAA